MMDYEITNKLDEYLLENVGENYEDVFNLHADTELKKAFIYLTKIESYDDFERKALANGEKAAKATLDKEIKNLKLSLIKKDEDYEKALKLSKEGRVKSSEIFEKRIKKSLEVIQDAIIQIEDIANKHTIPGTFVIAPSISYTWKKEFERLMHAASSEPLN